jgi:hypothetical protein
MKILLRLLDRMGAWARTRLSQIEEREARASALEPGICVTLSKCRCPYDHAGLWEIVEFNVDAGDYKIVRLGDGKRDYATRDIMEVSGMTILEARPR